MYVQCKVLLGQLQQDRIYCYGIRGKKCSTFQTLSFQISLGERRHAQVQGENSAQATIRTRCHAAARPEILALALAEENGRCDLRLASAGAFAGLHFAPVLIVLKTPY